MVIQKDALVFFDRSIKIDSSDQKAFFNRGNAKSKLKDFQSAIKDYERSIKINPKKRRHILALVMQIMN